MVEHLNMALGLHVQRLFHRSAVDEDRHIAIQNVDLLLSIHHHIRACKDAAHRDNDTGCDHGHTDDGDQLDLVFQIL